jgi:hypothetical protein
MRSVRPKRLEHVERRSHEVGAPEAPRPAGRETRQDGDDAPNAVGDAPRDGNALDDGVEELRRRADLVALARASFVERLLEKHRPEHDVVERSPARAR